MSVLIGCESSGIVRDAFLARGIDAMSCDLKPTERPGPHYQGDLFDVIDYPWDLAIIHIPCTNTSVFGGEVVQGKAHGRATTGQRVHVHAGVEGLRPYPPGDFRAPGFNPLDALPQARSDHPAVAILALGREHHPQQLEALRAAIDEEWITVEEWCRRTGDTLEAVYSGARRGYGRMGCTRTKPKGGRLWINRAGSERMGGREETRRRRRHRPSHRQPASAPPSASPSMFRGEDLPRTTDLEPTRRISATP
jgi:hypothetical protein